MTGFKQLIREHHGKYIVTVATKGSWLTARVRAPLANIDKLVQVRVTVMFDSAELKSTILLRKVGEHAFGDAYYFVASNSSEGPRRYKEESLVEVFKTMQVVKPEYQISLFTGD